MRFNKKRAASTQTAPDAVNLAGGAAFAQSDKAELVAILLTSTLEDQFYRKADQTAARLVALIRGQADKKFVARAAIHARVKGNLRSVSHLAAAEVARAVKGEPWTKRFFDRVVARPDDVLEILACVQSGQPGPIPNALKKGLGRALARFDAHQLAKYRRDGAELKLVDAVNLLHPPHTEALRALVRGELAPANTWEVKLTQAGQADAEDAED